MTETFSQYGVRFQYPDDWELTEQANDDGVTLSVSSPGTSFWTLQLLDGGPAPLDVVDQAIEAFRQEYEEIDFYPVETELCQRPAWGGDIEFVCLELINSAALRCFRSGRFTALVLFQGTDHELESTREILEAITGSLCCEDGETEWSNE